MRNLINFLLKNSSWFLFILLEIICFYFIFSNNSYQKSVFLNSSNEVTGRVYSISGSILSYFGLRQENQELLEKNAELQVQISELKDYLFTIEADSIKTEAFLRDSLGRRTEPPFIVARVEKNSISMIENYMIVNKGTNSGIRPDMGVISQQGIVGVVRSASANYAIVQPVLNPHSKFSCKILNSNTAGILLWQGGDSRYAVLTEYPKYERVEIGDTIVTSGFSDFFPEGLMVGTVEDYKSETDDNFYSLKIKLSTDFGSLKNVLLINNTNEEIKELENKVKNAKK
ncbi:rod shape-determining protein MreC [Dysgonomonas sp. PFB1-18]|uniref:rod shape-determining protein MreC n=1 Tax=unclassified Dysgonomonas TaxID=2630389 RepID=UPI0024743BB9|nr:MULTISPECIES: rod shape-determining protein MreC [unclassified Dysgonomonas]MDH6308816.1 rod shape-determining protein MreC [Dysgonomonas sp. PF1-14]MDH6338488.1 rod shape-determining protein MreC [Dysgonomonas sp. PF1-16]MDH6380065.1 rod shape-determining protein MreC [Dysgonomonas sp. PFB1-18]MDH6397316.1 rod shape-determining protein MreC [Dysgonomonas sp. PF1-23]